MDWVKTYPNEVSNWWVHEYGCHSYSPHIKFLGFSRETIHVEHLAMLLWTTMREFFPTSNMVIKYFGTSYISLDLVLNLFCGCKSNHQNKDPSPLTHGLLWITSIQCQMVSRKAYPSIPLHRTNPQLSLWLPRFSLHSQLHPRPPSMIFEHLAKWVPPLSFKAQSSSLLSLLLLLSEGP